MGEKEDKTRVEPQLSLNFVHLSLNCANIRAYPVGDQGQTDPGGRFQLTQPKTFETAAARRFAWRARGLLKIGSLGQKFIGANI